MKKVRLTQAGYEQFTGMFGRNHFTDGLSDEPLLPIHAHFIGAAINAEYEDGSPLNPALNYTLAGDMSPTEAVELAEKRIEAAVAHEKEVNAVKFTREDLEAIADKQGVKGLREIASPMGIKASSVAELIAGILKAQE